MDMGREVEYEERRRERGKVYVVVGSSQTEPAMRRAGDDSRGSYWEIKGREPTLGVGGA